MPYIKQEGRDKLDHTIHVLSDKIEDAGELNYTITKLLHGQLEKKGLNYANCNALIGVLDCASKEFYRKKVAPYEDIKIKENGDV